MAADVRDAFFPLKVAVGDDTPKSLSVQAYLVIRTKILKGDLRMGEIISRRQLAAELKMSVPPVAEALTQLEAEGLLESRPRAGTRVRVPTRQEIADRGMLREALECQSARLFAERATAEKRAEICRMGRQIDELYKCCDVEPVDREFLFLVNRYHMNFHLHIAECAGCGVLRDAIEQERVLIFNWLYETAAKPPDRTDTAESGATVAPLRAQRPPIALEAHSHLADALANGTVDQAVNEMRQHIRRGLEDLLAKLSPLSEVEVGWRVKNRRRAG